MNTSTGTTHIFTSTMQICCSETWPTQSWWCNTCRIDTALNKRKTSTSWERLLKLAVLYIVSSTLHTLPKDIKKLLETLVVNESKTIGKIKNIKIIQSFKHTSYTFRYILLMVLRLKLRGDCAVSIVGPKLWNSLSVSLWLVSSITI